MSRLLQEVEDLDAASIDFAKGIGHATAGDRLSKLMKASMADNLAPYTRLRAAVEARINALGGAGPALGLFMLAADMATAAEINKVSPDDRRALRRLWEDLRSR